jgi:hypothetical protein
MTPENEVEQVITRSLSAAEIMDLTGHNKWTLFPILHRLIRENKITKKNLRYAPTGYSDKLISNKQDQFFCADPFGLSGLRDNRDLQSNCGPCRLRLLRQESCKVLRQQMAESTVGLMEIGKPTTVDVKESANEGQIGGNHYKKLQIQPWDYILANNIGYCEASAIKYLSRWKDKGGIADLYKAKHFIDKLIEHEEQRVPKP